MQETQRSIRDIPVEEYRDFLAYHQEWLTDVGHVVVAPSETVRGWLDGMTRPDGSYTRPVTHGTPGTQLPLAESWRRKDQYQQRPDGAVILRVQ